MAANNRRPGEGEAALRIKTLHIEFTTACNSQCVMCDYWKDKAPRVIDAGLVLQALTQAHSMGLETVYFTGGECLLQAERLFSLCRQIRASFPRLRLGLITNGLLLKKYQREIAGTFHKVIVSLDAVDPARYREIRGVGGAKTVQEGVRLLKRNSPQTKVNLRVLVRHDNLDELPKLVDCARAWELDRVSFIPEDAGSPGAFGRTEAVRTDGCAPFPLEKLRSVLEQIRTCHADRMGSLLRPGLKDLERAYSLYAGDTATWPPCSKASLSCVIGADGTVSPCFFIGGTQRLSPEESLGSILSGESYRRRVREIEDRCDPACLRCPCPKILS